MVSGNIYDRSGVRLPAITGAALAVLGLAGLTFAAEAGIVAVTISMSLVTCGSMVAFTPLQTWGMNAIGRERLADGNAIVNTARQASTALGTALFVTVMSVASAAATGSAAAQAAYSLRITFTLALVIALILLAAIAIATRPSRR